jgi:hypothetical protein
MREPRQLNVQQQNARTLQSLRSTAEHWRTHPVPEALLLAARQRGVDLSSAIVVDLEIDFPGMPSLFGVLLTKEERFVKFEIDTEQSEPEVYEWRDITASQNLSEHNRGIGVGDGALAIQVLHALDA